MHEKDFYELFGEDMYDSDPEDDTFDLDNVYHVPMEMVLYMRDRQEPIFAEHVFFFEKNDPVQSIEELMNFTATWWGAITEDKNIDYIFLTDSSFNKKAIYIRDVVATSFMAPPKPDWMNDEQDTRDPS